MEAKGSFARELAKNETEINLAHAALLISQHLNQASDLSAYYLPLLDDIAEALRPAVLAAKTDAEVVKAFNHYLFEELQFHGNGENYYSPNNSFLDKVLDLRTGIPISLSVVCLEIGWRLGLPLAGLGLPGHFIIGYNLPAAPIYIDVFNRGLLLSEDDCFALAQMPPSERLAFREEFLRPVSKRVILFRMLLNLKQIYLRLEDWELAHRTIDLMLLVYPELATEIRDRGVVAYRLNRLREAVFDIQRYLFLVPNAPDANWLKQHLELMEERLSRLN
ncbi:MAG TPA: tetratricopeptide repeat protein [Anaerolineae bacterium]|nr:tetratricopeptide repeat protein [Anaerolineae bacterium]